MLSILWNTYNYFAQFSSQVAAVIKEKRAPIEKKLRDFVKICSWDRDLSYWSVKDTVEKVHKVLHKHTKEFEVRFNFFMLHATYFTFRLIFLDLNGGTQRRDPTIIFKTHQLMLYIIFWLMYKKHLTSDK